jgi:hypothetical protein
MSVSWNSAIVKRVLGYLGLVKCTACGGSYDPTYGGCPCGG